MNEELRSSFFMSFMFLIAGIFSRVTLTIISARALAAAVVGSVPVVDRIHLGMPLRQYRRDQRPVPPLCFLAVW